MGKNLIQQARGKGGPRYRAPSFRYKAKVSYPSTAGEGKIVDFVKCRGHSAPLAQLKCTNGEESFIIAAEGMKTGDSIRLGQDAPNTTGNTLYLKDIPIGTSIFNIEIMPGDGGKFVRSGGCFARVLAKNDKEVVIMLPSKKERALNPNCRATIGSIAGSGRKDKPFLKAGTRHFYMKARNKLYPRVKGQSQNAVDHPYGTSRSSKKGQPTIADKNAPPGAKVGKVKAKKNRYEEVKMAKELTFKGKTIEELRNLSLNEFSQLIPSRARRSLNRGITPDQKNLLEKIKTNDKDIKTHARDMIIIPALVGQMIKIYNGKEFMQVLITEEMLGHTLGEFSHTRRRVTHNSPGVGATKSSSSVSVR